MVVLPAAPAVIPNVDDNVFLYLKKPGKFTRRAFLIVHMQQVAIVNRMVLNQGITAGAFKK